MVKLIAIDLDGTLLNSKKQVDRQTIDLLARYARQYFAPQLRRVGKPAGRGQ